MSNKCFKSEIKEIKNEVIEDNVEYYGEVYKVEEIKHEIKDEDIEDDVKFDTLEQNIDTALSTNSIGLAGKNKYTLIQCSVLDFSMYTRCTLFTQVW